jgi:hypothetical protein
VLFSKLRMSASRIPFDPREQRTVSDLVRWMNLLGRFQIIAATFTFIVFLAAVALVTTADVLEPVTRGAGDQPLFALGDVSRTAIAVFVAIVVGFSLLFMRGGMLLISSAEDLELMITTGEKEQHHLDGALRRLRSYFVLESILMAGIVVLVYAATILQGSGLG